MAQPNSLPIESVIRERQADYYNVLGRCDKAGSSTGFIEFALDVTLHSLAAASTVPFSKMSGVDRIENARSQFQDKLFSRQDYLAHFPALSPATASRDLKQAVASDLLRREGDKATARYRFLTNR